MKASKKFGLMSNEQFANYLYNNPGGASKAFLLRCEGVPKQEVRVEYRTEVKKEVEWRDKVVEVPVEVVREVEVEKVIEKGSGVLIGTTVFFMVVSLLALMAYGGKEVNPVSYVDREVEVVKEVERVVEKPVEVVKEVIREVRVEVPVIKEVVVSDEYTESTLRDAVAVRDKEIDRLHRRLGDMSTRMSRLRFGR